MKRNRSVLGFLVLTLAFGCKDGGGGPSAWPPAATVYLDRYGIPHADCQTDEDCAMALGYFHAKDRFVQMDLQRRLSTGRLTQVVNRAFVESVGLLEPLIDTAAANRALYSSRDGRPAEERAAEQMDDKTTALFEAYAVGVNQWIAELKSGETGAVWPAEFESALLDYDPEDVPEWTVTDSLATVLTLIGSLTNDERTQLRAASAREQIDDNLRYQDLWSLEPLHKTSVLEPGTFTVPQADALSTRRKRERPEIYSRARKAMATLSAQLEATDPLRQLFPEVVGVPHDVGSNNWALGPTKTASGNAFFSADSHLELSQPSVFYLAHLDSKTHGSGTMHTAGFSFAGLPYLFFAQNEHIAWGSTNGSMDLTDLYLEELVKDDEGNPIGVLFNDEVVELIRTDFTMEFSDGSTETRELLFVPHHGALRAIDLDNDVAISLRWTANDITTDANFLTKMAVASTVAEARDAMESISALGQNYVVIDDQGSFGWFPYSLVPKRTWAQNLDLSDPAEPFPWLPLLGTGAYEWVEFYDYEDLPQAIDDARGWIATANNDFTGAAFDGNPTNDGFAPHQTDRVRRGYRAGRIAEVLEATDQHTRATNEALVHDVLLLIARAMLPNILAIANDNQTTLTANAQKVVNALTDWTFTCPTGLEGHDPVMSPLAGAAEVKEASGCTAWHEVLRDINDAVVGDEASSKSFPSSATFFSIVDPANLRAGDVYWDDRRTAEVETKYDIIGAAFDTAGAVLVAELGEDEAVWPWGRKHGFQLTSVLVDLSSLFSEFSNPPGNDAFFANPGGLFTVDVASPNAEGRHGSGAGLRFQCEGTQPPRCTVQLPGGQSSHRGSAHYEDLLLLWLDRQPIPLGFDIDEAAVNAVETFDFR